MHGRCTFRLADLLFDNVAITAGSGTAIATDTIGGAEYQRMKPAWGVDGTAVDTSDTNPLPTVSGRGATATLANITGSATVLTLQASNAGRRAWCVHNDSEARLLVKLGSGASATSFTRRLEGYEFWALPFLYTGIITGIWESASGFARVTEITA
jgi:hypothetical protein